MSKKILIVDDERFIRTLLVQTLEDFQLSGVELLEAEEGNAAWDLIQTHRPDLVILDLMIPGPSGHEICQRVKTDAHLTDTYVIVLTAKTQASDRKRSFDSGADEYITKPFDPADLAERVAVALNVSSQ